MTIATSINKGNPENCTSSMRPTANPFFIVSSGRSGTTLLASMLNATGQIMIPPESDFIARAYPFYKNKVELHDDDYVRMIALFMVTSQMRGWNLKESYLMSVLAQERPKTYREVNSAICRSFLKEHGCNHQRWGVKAPVLIASVNRILKVFPNARIVHLVRDGRDVSLSYRSVHEMGQPFGPKRIFTCALYWVDGLRRIQKLKDRTKLLEIRYEDLLMHTDKTKTELFQFLDIGQSRGLDKVDESANMIIDHRHKNTIHKKIGNKLDVSNYEKYKIEMSRVAIFVFEMFAAPYLIKYDYEVSYRVLCNPAFGAIRMPLYLLARILNDIRYAVRDATRYRHAIRNVARSRRNQSSG
ncbi:MAG: sulfotransferase family protein [Terriglobia bacterium]